MLVCEDKTSSSRSLSSRQCKRQNPASRTTLPGRHERETAHGTPEPGHPGYPYTRAIQATPTPKYIEKPRTRSCRLPTLPVPQRLGTHGPGDTEKGRQEEEEEEGQMEVE